MINTRTLSSAMLSLITLLGAAKNASADVNTSFRKSYTGDVTGDANFDAGYGLDYGMTASKNGGTAKLTADAGSKAWVSLFKKRFDAVSLKATAVGTVSTGAPSCAANITYETYLVGIKLPTASGTIAGGQFANKEIVSRTQKLTPKASIDLVRIGPAVLGLEAYASATEYIRLNGVAWCNSISAELRPGAKLTAVANFRADAVIVAAGLRGTLTLMDVAVPASASVGFSWKQQADFFDGQYCSWSANASAKASVEVIPVSGKFEPWVRVGLPCTDVFGLLPGKGICLNKEWNHVLWSASASKSTFNLASTSGAPFIGTNTASCPPNPPKAPNR